MEKEIHKASSIHFGISLIISVVTLVNRDIEAQTLARMQVSCIKTLLLVRINPFLRGKSTSSISAQFCQHHDHSGEEHTGKGSAFAYIALSTQYQFQQKNLHLKAKPCISCEYNICLSSSN